MDWCICHLASIWRRVWTTAEFLRACSWVDFATVYVCLRGCYPLCLEVVASWEAVVASWVARLVASWVARLEALWEAVVASWVAKRAD